MDAQVAGFGNALVVLLQELDAGQFFDACFGVTLGKLYARGVAVSLFWITVVDNDNLKVAQSLVEQTFDTLLKKRRLCIVRGNNDADFGHGKISISVV